MAHPDPLMDGSLAFEEYGSGAPLILGTSYLWDARMWRPQIEALAARYRIIVPLLPGHGNDVILPADVRTPAELASCVGTLLDGLGIGNAAVAGLSVGGMWAAELALQRPHQVRALLLMDTFLGSEPEVSRNRYEAMFQAVEAAGRFEPALVQQIVPLFFRPGIDQQHPLFRELTMRLLAWPAARIATLIAVGRLIFQRPERLAALAALDPSRTLIAVGAQDIPRPPSESRTMAALIGCRLQVIADAGHIASLENAQAVTAMMHEWLSATAAAS